MQNLHALRICSYVHSGYCVCSHRFSTHFHCTTYCTRSEASQPIKPK